MHGTALTEALGARKNGRPVGLISAFSAFTKMKKKSKEFLDFLSFFSFLFVSFMETNSLFNLPFFVVSRLKEK